MSRYSSSRLKVFRECMRKYFYQYRLHVASPSTPAAAFGTVGHEALEAYFTEWQAGNMDNRLPAANAAIRKSSLSHIDQIKLLVLLAAYDLRWGDEDWEILAVEADFAYILPDGIDEHVIHGRIDALIRRRSDSRVFVLEHKCTALDTSYGNSYWEKLAIDSQVSIYIDGASTLGHEIAGCIYDVLKRPQHDLKLATPVDARKYTQGKGCKMCGGKLSGGIQGSGKSTATQDGNCAVCRGTGWRLDEQGEPEAPRLHSNQRAADESLAEFEDRINAVIAESPDAFLIRGEVVRLQDELEPMRADLVNTIKLERMTEAVGLYPRNPDSCNRYGRLCEFFDACASRASIDDIHRFPRRQLAHSEPVGIAA